MPCASYIGTTAYGDIDFKRLVKLLEKEDIPQYSDKPQDNEPNVLTHQPIGQTITRELHTHQAHVMTGCRAYAYTDPRRMTLYLLNNILGGPGMNARLNLSLRERHGLVYTVESSMASYGDCGLWCVYFGCDHHDIHQNREQFALDFGRSYLHHGQERNLEQLYQRIDAITAEEIQQVANELFATDVLTTLIFK